MFGQKPKFITDEDVYKSVKILRDTNKNNTSTTSNIIVAKPSLSLPTVLEKESNIKEQIIKVTKDTVGTVVGIISKLDEDSEFTAAMKIYPGSDIKWVM